MKILAEIPLRKGFESERFQVSTALFQHVNELSMSMNSEQVPRFQGSSVAVLVSGLGQNNASLPDPEIETQHSLQNVCKQDL